MGSMNPISDRVVLDAERQQEQRNRLAVGAWLPAVRPWDGTPSQNRFETEAIDGIGSWLESGDMEAVKKWLTFFLESRDDWRELLAAIHKAHRGCAYRSTGKRSSSKRRAWHRCASAATA